MLTIKSLRSDGQKEIRGGDFNDFCSKMVKRGYTTEIIAGPNMPGYVVKLTGKGKIILGSWNHKTKKFNVSLELTKERSK